MNCRGYGTRERIIKEYEVIPVAHIKLLAGRELNSDAGDTLTDSYYLFECVKRTTGRKDSICCGSHVAKDFSKLTGKPLPTLFNPLQLQEGRREGNSEHDETHKGIAFKDRGQQQLYNAIMLIIVAFDLKPNTVIFSIKKQVENKRNEPIDRRCLAGINTILMKYETTMPEIIENLSKHNNIKNFEFDLLTKQINQMNRPNSFE